MKTFYLTQGGALEEYLKQGGDGPPGNGNPRPCENICANASPNSNAYKRCGCDGSEPPAASIDQYILPIMIGFLLVALAIIFKNVFLPRKNK